MKLHHLLQQEAEELKRLLGERPDNVAGSSNAVDSCPTRAMLARLKTGLAARRLHEAGASASEVR